MKNRYSMTILLEYFDGELSEKESTYVAEGLLDDYLSSEFLEKVTLIDNQFRRIENIEVSDKTKNKIFKNAFELLDKRKEFKKKKFKIPVLKWIDLREIFKNVSLEFQYGFVALAILITTTFYAGRGSIVPGNLNALSEGTMVYSREEVKNSLEEISFESENTSEEI